MKFVLASHNQGKLAEMQRILGQLGVEVVLQSELGLALEPEETGTTFTENARMENLRGAGTRAAHFHTSVVCCFPNGNVLEAEGDCHGTIAYAPQGENGFGYDPVFFVPELRKTFAQLTPEEKNAISHRGVALRAFGEKLKEYMENH